MELFHIENAYFHMGFHTYALGVALGAVGSKVKDFCGPSPNAGSNTYPMLVLENWLGIYPEKPTWEAAVAAAIPCCAKYFM